MDYLGHIDKKNQRQQSLIDHCYNVAELSECSGADIKINNLMKLAGLLHDMGKAKQSYIDYFQNNTHAHLNHSSAGAQYIYETFFIHKDQLDGKESFNNLTVQIISSIICSHHGELINEVDLDNRNNFELRMTSPFEDKENTYKNYFHEVCSEEKIHDLFYKAINEIMQIFCLMKIKAKKREQVCFELGLLTRFCFSILIDSDWYDTACFFDDQKNVKLSDHHKLFCHWQKKLERYIQNNFAVDETTTDINKYRSSISEKCLQKGNEKTGIYRLFVPTGGGKTISGLRFALSHAKKNSDIKRIIYVAPYLTILRQNSKEITDILDHNECILQHFSDLVYDEDQKQNEDLKKELYIERWNSPFIITSMVQFLNTLFSGKKASVRRMHQLANSIIIFDEIQMLPPKVTNMFNSAMNFLSGVANSTIVLCSATQPDFKHMKQQIFMDEGSDIVDDYYENFRLFKRVQVYDELKDKGYTTIELTTFMKEKIEQKNSALIIMNTKRAANNMYKSICEWNAECLPTDAYQIFYLTTNMCLQHRNEVLSKIEELLKAKKVICITTSLIEAGVDISFEMVIRDCAGLDSIAQAAGRCNRHKELDQGHVYIINYKEEHLGNLSNIAIGKKITTNLLHHFKQYPEQFDEDMLSPKALEVYYRDYYNEIKDQLSYPIKDIGDLYNMLSRSTSKFGSLVLLQAFEDAGKYFKVIEEDTINVIVPYGRGIEIIDQLEHQNLDIKSVQTLLKQAQAYSIAIHKNMLKNHVKVSYLEAYGVYILEKEEYDDYIGLKNIEFSADFV